MLTLNCYHYLQVFSFETLVKRYIFDFLSVKNFAIKSVKNSWIMRASIIWGLMSECQKKKISEKWNYRFFVLSVSFHEGGGYILDNVKKKRTLIFSSRLTRQRTCTASLTLFQQENKNLYSLPFSDHSNDGGISKSALKPRGFDKQQARKHVRCLLYWKYVKSSYVRIFHYGSIIPQS